MDADGWWCSANQKSEDAFWMSQSWCLVPPPLNSPPPPTPNLVSEIGKSTKDQHHHRVARISFLKHTLMHLFLPKRKFTGRSVRVDFVAFFLVLRPVSDRKTALEEQAAACSPRFHSVQLALLIVLRTWISFFQVKSGSLNSHF